MDYASQEGYLKARIISILNLIRRAQKQSKETALPGDSKHPNFIKHNKNLSRYILELDQKRALLGKVKSKIKELYPNASERNKSELISISNAIKSSLGDKNLWDDFKMYFENVNPEFLQLLKSKHPALTLKDLKYCCYLKMNMSNNDICHHLGINQESVRTHKYRLKSKMELPKERDLHQYLNTLAQNKMSG